MGSGIESRRDNIRWKKVLGSESELGGVRVWRAGPFFIHTLSEGIFRNRKFLSLWTILFNLAQCVNILRPDFIS